MAPQKPQKTRFIYLILNRGFRNIQKKHFTEIFFCFLKLHKKPQNFKEYWQRRESLLFININKIQGV